MKKKLGTITLLICMSILSSCFGKNTYVLGTTGYKVSLSGQYKKIDEKSESKYAYQIKDIKNDNNQVSIITIPKDDLPEGQTIKEISDNMLSNIQIGMLKIGGTVENNTVNIMGYDGLVSGVSQEGMITKNITFTSKDTFFLITIQSNTVADLDRIYNEIISSFKAK